MCENNVWNDNKNFIFIICLLFVLHCESNIWKILLLFDVEGVRNFFSLKFLRVEKSRRLSSIADAGNVGEVEWETP